MFDEDKTDRNDAFRIADFLRIQRFTTSPIKEEKYLALQRLTRTRYQLIQQLVEAKQHFLENLTYKCNTLTRELKNSTGGTSLFGSTILSLLTEDYSLDDLAMMPIEDFVKLLQDLGKSRFKNPSELAKTIKKAIRGSYRLGQVAKKSIDTILSVIAGQIERFDDQTKLAKYAGLSWKIKQSDNY